MTGRRTGRWAPLVGLGLVVSGAAVVLLAAGRTWAVAEVAAGGLTRPAPVTGADLASWARPAGLVFLAGAGALALAGRVGRALVGGLLCLVAVAVAVDAVVAVVAAGELLDLGEVDLRPAWPATTLAGCAAVAVGGAAAVAYGGRWPTPRRHERPVPSGRPRTMWEALDRGEDPSEDPTGDPTA